MPAGRAVLAPAADPRREEPRNRPHPNRGCRGSRRGGSLGSILPRRIKAPTTAAQNFRITDDGGKLRATCATWDDAVRGPSRQEGGMTREKAVDLVMKWPGKGGGAAALSLLETQHDQ
jgi:hypothetical protein